MARVVWDVQRISHLLKPAERPLLVFTVCVRARSRVFGGRAVRSCVHTTVRRISHLLEPAEPAEPHQLMRQHTQLLAHQRRLCHCARATAGCPAIG